ncbi:MAG: class I SAM-dependent methyltransferase [Candidatus Saccharimonas sp.]
MSFFRGVDDWNQSYEDGEWDYLVSDNSEISRQALVAAQCGPAGSKNDSTASVLDLGCGEGLLSEYLHRGERYVGVDIAPIAIEIAKRKHPTAKFNSYDIGSISFANELLAAEDRYDNIVLNEVLYYLSDKELMNLCEFIEKATILWSNPRIITSICRSDLHTIRHSSHYWAVLFDKFNHQSSIEIADLRHTWDIKVFKGIRGLGESR